MFLSTSRALNFYCIFSCKMNWITQNFAKFIYKNQLFIVFIFMLLFSFITCTKSKVPFFLKKSICVTETCDTFGSKFEESLNKSVNPCDNFYQYSCGGWTSQSIKPDYEPIWNNWQALTYKINDQIHQIFESTDYNQDQTFRKIKTFYNSCMEVKSMERIYLDCLRDAVEEFGGWPIQKMSWNGEKFNTFTMIAEITRILDIHPIININVNIDYKNTTRQVIYIQPGDFIFPHYILREPRKYKPEMNAYKTWIYETVTYLFPKVPKSTLKYDINRLVGLEVTLAKLMTRSRNERSTVEKLSKKLKIDWKKILTILFHQTGIEIRMNDVIVVKNISYLKSVISLLRKVNDRIIANYLMWNIVKDLSRETSQYMRNLNSAIDQAVLGTSTDIPRKHECLNKVKTYFSYALVTKYVDNFMDPNTLSHVANISDNIKIAFIKLLNENTWLNDNTRSLAIEKVKNIKYFIGYPEYTDNTSNIKAYYKHVNVSDHHFYNILRLKRVFSQQSLMQLRETNLVRWPSNAFEVNGYYSILQNAIFIPMGLTQAPFFSIKRPDVLNYGAIGSLIGHEFTHSLDSIGRHADKDGVIKRWWKKEDIEQYDEKSECYKNYYDQFNVDGYLTTGENIADNIGLKLSYIAYKSQDSSEFSTSLTRYTNDQLFFMSFGQMWCEISATNDIFSLDEHAPTEKRVMGTVYNSNFFTEAFACKNFKSETKCNIW